MDAAWVGVVGAVIGVLIGSGITLGYSVWRDRWEREERQKDRDEHYKQTLYPRRLETHQQAYLWLRKLVESLDTDNNKIKDITSQAHDWWYSNCLYLDQESRERVFDAISSTKILADPSLSDDGIKEERKEARFYIRLGV